MIKEFDVVLKGIEESDLERVLTWRNSDHIRQYALNPEIITYEEHKRWFDSLKSKGDRYFIIKKEDQDVGLIWAKGITDESCETGFYLHDWSVQNTLFAYRVSITLNNYLFYAKSLKYIYCDILDTNDRSIRFSLSLGYEKYDQYEKHGVYRLKSEDYKKKSSKIIKLLTKKK